MKQKTIIARDSEELDKRVNEFVADHPSKASHSYGVATSDGEIMHVRVLFYE